MKKLEDIPETTWAYLAGLFDGEGSIALNRRRDRPNTVETSVAQLCNMNKNLMNYVHDLVDAGNIITVRHYDKLVCTYSLYYRVEEAKIVLPKVIPYLGLKKEVAEIVLEAILVKQNNKHQSKIKDLQLIEIEKRYKEAVLRSKPWLRDYPYVRGHRGKRSTRQELGITELTNT